MPDLLHLAEKVIVARAELAAAEQAFHRAAGFKPRGSQQPATKPASRSFDGGPSVSQRVRDLLQDGKKAMAFGEIVGVLGSPSKMAVRAALKKLRATNQVSLKEGAYSWKGAR